MTSTARQFRWTTNYSKRKVASVNFVFPNLVKRFFPITAIVLCSGIAGAAAETKVISIASPNGRLAVDFHLNADGAPRYAIQSDGKLVLRDSRLGLVRDDADFSQGLRLISESRTETVRDKYEILTAKRRMNDYRANKKVFHLQTAGGQKMDIIFQISDDGVAFRYFFPETNSAIHKLIVEVSSFHFLSDTRAWLQPMQVAKTGFQQSNPAYEEYYQKDISVGTP